MDQFLTDLTPGLVALVGRGALVEVSPGDPLMGGGARPAVGVEVSSRHVVTTTVGAGTWLRLAVGVIGDGQRMAGRSAIRFTVSANDREIYRRDVNPARSRYDRRWFDERIGLPADLMGAVTLTFTTSAVSPDQPAAGRPAWNYARTVREERRPRQSASAGQNVIVIVVDTLRADALGPYGARPSPTPRLDAFAAGGRVFEQSISTSSWTLPSTASILTGLSVRSHGLLGGDDEAARNSQSFLAESIVTLAEAAVAAGITTIGVSANPLVARETNLAQGFETFVQYGFDGRARNWQGPARTMRADFTDWLRTNRGVRFLAYLHFMDVHDPYTPPPGFMPPVPDGIRPAIRNGQIHDTGMEINWQDAPPLTPIELHYVRALYDGEIRGWDAEFGELLDTLDALGFRATTDIIVTADHGEEFQDHGHLKHGMTLYEEVIRVPLIIAGPDVAPGRTTTQVQGIDLYPTVTALLGALTPAGLPGTNVLGIIPERSMLVATHNARPPSGPAMELLAVRTPAQKLIVAPRIERVELFDLLADPREATNLRDDRAQVATWRETLARLVNEATPTPAATAVQPDLTRSLRQLGYVQ